MEEVRKYGSTKDQGRTEGSRKDGRSRTEDQGRTEGRRKYESKDGMKDVRTE